MMVRYELSNIVFASGYLKQIKKADLMPGDELMLITKNSRYVIRVDADGEYSISGGWFNKMYETPVKIKINGCTWGGSIIKTDIAAACGLYTEFSNRLVTSRIQKIFHFPGILKN